MDYFFLMFAVLGSIHGYTFALWLKKNGNKIGTIGVYILIAVNVALPLYRIISAQ